MCTYGKKEKGTLIKQVPSPDHRPLQIIPEEAPQDKTVSNRACPPHLHLAVQSHDKQGGWISSPQPMKKGGVT